MSQKALADAMRGRGHKWSQSTVWAAEKGDRPLKLSEARDLEDLLDVYTSGEWFRSEPGLTTVSRATTDLSRVRRKAVDALAEHLKERMRVWAVLSDAWEAMPRERKRLMGSIGTALGASSDPEWIVEEAQDRAAGSERQVIVRTRGDEFPRREETVDFMRSEERAIEQLFRKMEAFSEEQGQGGNAGESDGVDPEEG